MIATLLLAGAVATAVSLLATPAARALAKRLRIMDDPDPRKVHRDPMPYLGGLGILLAVYAGIACAAFADPSFAAVHERALVTIAIGAAAVFSIGLWDDTRRTGALAKLLLQTIVAAGSWYGGLRIDSVPQFFGAEIPFATSPVTSLLLTVFWFNLLMNAINLIDGLDGLAGGVAALSACSIAAIAVVGGAERLPAGGVIAIAAAGGAIGFLRYNWHPASIFLGDAGALLLGYLLASAALLGSAKASTLQAMLVPLVAVGLPVFEVVFSFLRRALTGRSPFQADRRHLHHRLLDIGLPQSRVVGILLFATAFLGVNAVLLARAGSMLLLLNVAFLGLGLILLLENLRYLEKTNGRK